MHAAAAQPFNSRGGGMSALWRRQLDSYPDTAARTVYLAITVLATITLYYQLYVAGSVSTLILANLHMSFTFFVFILGFGNLVGAFGSLFAGIADRWGRANLVVGGLLLTGLFSLVVIPAATNRWEFGAEYFVVGLIEGICLVATPALIRDFSPQVGRATAMGFWTSGPVIGSLIVAAVGTATIPAAPHPRFWGHEYVISGVVGLAVFAIALVGLRELSPPLRDQIMVTTRDRALVEARARGMDIQAALRHPWRQLLKADVIISSFAVAIMLLFYYTAVGFSVIYLTTVFGFSVRDATGLGNWNWGFNVVAVIVIGLVSDRFRVRKPFMVIGGVVAAAMTVVYLMQVGHHPGYYTLAIILAVLSFALGVAYTPWMASFTETVEARNPALTATGLAIWGWILRVVAFASFLVIPVVIHSVTPLVDYGSQVATYAAKYKSEIAFAQSHPQIVATARKIPLPVLAAAQKIPPSVVATAQKIPPPVLATAQKIPPGVLANAQRFAPEIAVIQADPTLFITKLGSYHNTADIPASLQTQAIAAAGGGTKGLQILSTMSSNQAAITAVLAAAPELKIVAPYAAGLQTIAPYTAGLKLIARYTAGLQTIAPYSVQVAALAKVPPGVFSFLKAHAAAVQKAAVQAPRQWQTWYWVCVGGIVFFLLSIPLLRGRWRPRDARRDEDLHQAMVQAELARLRG